MTYKIVFADSVAAKDWPALPKTIRTRIRTALEERLQTEPQKFGKPLKGSLSGCRRLRVGDYRIVYLIRPSTQDVLILIIKHRKDVYDEA